MNWTSLIGPAVVAAVISGIVATIGIWISARTARHIHTEKLAFDREQAEQKFEFDKRLAEHKVDLDTGLAERKFVFDKDVVAWRRRYELAEQILSAAYEARATLKWARGRLIRQGEGETRKATGPESDKLRDARNSAFVPAERLFQNSKPFDTLQTLQDVAAAHFGPEAVKPISAIAVEHHGITDAVAILLQMVGENDDGHTVEALRPIRARLWGEEAKEANKNIDAAIEQLEALCKPALSAKWPT